MVLAFGECVLDFQRRELWRGGARVPVEPQVFDILAYLIRHRDRAVRKDDLVWAIWGGRAISDAALTTRINAVRRTIGDDGKTQRAVRTLPRTGYRFVAEVEESPISRLGETKRSRREESNSASASKRVIGVLPFASIGGQPETRSFADALAEELVVALSRTAGIGVVALAPPQSGDRAGVPIGRLGRERSVRYVLDGSVRGTGPRLRITARLFELATGLHLWADHFNAALGNDIEMQARIASKISAMVQLLV